jgi:hypothetical protein
MVAWWAGYGAGNWERDGAMVTVEGMVEALKTREG